jgi:hypothetical protein
MTTSTPKDAASNPVDPAELEAAGHEDIAAGHQKIAQAMRLRLATKDETSSIVWIYEANCEQVFGFKFRRILDAGLRAELLLHRAGGRKRGRPMARRADVDTWLAGQRITPKPSKAQELAPDAEASAAYLRLVEGGE